jgi:threonine/homoserine/homoserine lactone efflux protein
VDWTVWTMFALTEAALSASPGPAVLFVVSQGLRGRSLAPLLSAGGILGANAVYFALSGTGVGGALAGSGSLFPLVKWAGAGYVLYLGVRALLRPEAEARLALEPPRARSAAHRGLFVRGFLLQLSNPKALLFFVAILPQFIDPERPILLQIALMGTTSIALEFLILLAYGTAASGAARLASRPGFAAALSRSSGLLLVAAALGIARL